MHGHFIARTGQRIGIKSAIPAFAAAERYMDIQKHRFSGIRFTGWPLLSRFTLRHKPMQKKLYIKGQSAYCTVWAYAQKTSTISEKPNALYPPPPRISRSHPKRHCPGFSLFPVVPAGFFLSFSVFRRYAIGLPRRQAPTSTPEKPPCNRKPSIGLTKTCWMWTS